MQGESEKRSFRVSMRDVENIHVRSIEVDTWMGRAMPRSPGILAPYLVQILLGSLAIQRTSRVVSPYECLCPYP